MGFVSLHGASHISLSARFRAAELYHSNYITIDNSIIGGTKADRATDSLVYIPCCSEHVTIDNSEIGWTVSDNTSNTAYGIRVLGNSEGPSSHLHIEGNWIHDLAEDGIQGFGNNAEDVVIDRNEIGPVEANPGSTGHSDDIQVINNGPNLRISDNWIKEQGYYEGEGRGSSGTLYVHGESDGATLIENNLFSNSRGRVEICGLGTGGTERSNITIRRNTFSELGQAYSSFPGFEWDCDSGANDTITRNIAVDPDGGLAQDGFASAIVAPNLWGTPSLVTLDSQGNCTSANCNPAGQEPIGYRKPSGVHW
jgi:hypothetical protein